MKISILSLAVTVFTVLYAAFLLPGCQSTQPLLSTLASDYLPFAVNNRWTFIRNDTTTFTITVTGTVEKDGYPAWEIKGMTAGISNYFMSISSRIIAYDSDVNQSYLWYKYLETPLVLGNTWQTDIPLGYYQNNQFVKVGAYLYKAAVKEKNEKRVPVGLFSNCYRVDLSADYSPVPSGLTFAKSTQTVWFAPGVGWISFETKTYDASGTQLSYEDASLESYSVKK